MNNKFTSSEKLGDIVVQFPKAADIFKEYQIDFCCGGNRPLLEAIKEKNLNEKEVMEKINKAYEEFKNIKVEEVNWEKAKYSDLIDYVVNTHHSYLTKELPIISEFTTKILRVHGAGHSELAKVHKLFHNLKMELDQHLIKEEEIVFPLIKEYEKDQSKETLIRALAVIEELESEHEGAGDILKELRIITNQYEVPADACGSYMLTYKKLQELESDLFQHIHLENNIMFPRLSKEKK